MQLATTKPPVPDAPPPGGTSSTAASASEFSRTESPGIAITAAGKGLIEKHLKLLADRGITPETASRLGWKSSTRSGSGEWVEMPFFMNGLAVNSKFRTIAGPKQFSQTPGGFKTLYNHDAIRAAGGQEIVVTEGEMDCAIALQCGFHAVSVPDGAPAQKVEDPEAKKYTYLEPLKAITNTLILAVDSDQAGTNLLHDLSIRLGKHRCKWVRYPKGCKDLNETFMQYGVKGVEAALAKAEFIKIDGVFRMADLPPLPEPLGYGIGISGLEEKLKLRKGDFSIVTGVPSHGKTSVVNCIAANMAKVHSWNVCFASFEQAPQTQHRKALATLCIGKPYYRLNTEEQRRADEWINKYFSFIVPNNDSNGETDLQWLLEKSAAAVKQFGADMVVVDPWNEMDHYSGRDMTQTQYVGFAIKQLKKFASRYQIHMLVVAHPTKMLRNPKSGEYPVPSLWDVSDSSHWYNKSDLGMVVHRKDQETLLRVAKSRYHHDIGKPGDYYLRFDDYTGQFAYETAQRGEV